MTRPRRRRTMRLADNVTVRGIPASEINAFIQEGQQPKTAKVIPLPTCSCGDSDVYDGYAQCEAHPEES